MTCTAEPFAPLDACLPQDADHAHLIGRVWWPHVPAGPRVVALRQGALFDLTREVSTVADLLDRADRLWLAACAPAPCLGPLQDFVDHTADAPASRAHLLAPCDLQAIKACGVTFARSLIERVIEEQAGGDPLAAAALRSGVESTIGVQIGEVMPGSPQALQVKAALQARGAWSQYLEVGLGVDAEVFTKAQPLSAARARSGRV
jgi:fumarylacetoacetate (FAA) hydrolase family protein